MAVLILAGGVAWLLVQRRRRRDAVRRRAEVMAGHGWSVVSVDPGLAVLAGQLTFKGRATQMFAGGFPGGRVLDYEFTARRGPAPVHLVALPLPVVLPRLTVSKESVLARGDIELESQAFNEQFDVQADDERFASAVLQPRLMEWMLQNPELQWHLAGSIIVSWGYGEIAPSEVTARLEALAGVVDRIPPFVLRDYEVA